MMAIFSDQIEKVMEVFMDDFTMNGKIFEDCLANLDKVMKQCQMANLVLNWEKCHFMVREGIVLGHKISEKGIKMDKVKIEVIEQLPPPTNVKGIHSFLGLQGFIKDSFRIFLRLLDPSRQRCSIRLHERVSSIIPHFEEGTHFRAYYTTSLLASTI
jgi:hypothetical protein